MEGRIETILSVENIRVRARHGWYKQERAIGGVYIINVHLSSSASIVQEFEELSSTINYEIIYDKVLQVMRSEHKLIEHCCKAIFDEMKSILPDGKWEVELIKESPPIKHLGRTKYKIKG